MAQGTFSVDFQGPPIGVPDACAGGPPLTEGDILRTFTGAPAFGPSPGPCIYIGAGPGGLAIPAYGPGYPAGVVGFVEVDALSYGRDQRLRRSGPARYNWYFSVDEWAMGQGFAPPPNVLSEGAVGNLEASADLFFDAGVGPGPWCIAPAGMGNVAFIDGDGFFPFGAVGLGLIEPNPFGPGVPDAGTNLDAVDIDTPNLAPPVFPVFISLDSPFPDLLEGFANSGSAFVNGFGVGGDIFMIPAPGAPPVLWAPAPLLGLDLFGPDTDDLDALVIVENGTGVFEPSVAPYDWLTGATDMVMFSVRRGSAVIGVVDGICGLPIEEGDILVPTTAVGAPPNIWIPAEALGLATVRSGFAVADDLDALDTLCMLPGDVDGDGDVDITDLGIVLANFGCAAPPACPGDANGDGVVNIADLGLVLANFGASC
jgi:hypothetical protein